MLRILLIAFAVILCLAAAPRAEARESGPVVTPHVTVTLASDVDAVAPGHSFHLGLHFKLAQGWHIYWSNPGVAGEPPHLDLTLPKGAAASAIIWPTPLRVREGPAMTYSYLNEALLPVAVTVPDKLASFPVKAQVSWLVCANICVPEQGRLALALPIGTPTPSAQTPLFDAAEARVPRPSPYVAQLTAGPTLSLTGGDLTPQNIKNAWFLPAAWGEIDDLAPQKLTVRQGALTLALKPGETFDPKNGLGGVLVLQDHGGHERFFTVAARPAGAAALSKPSTTASPASRSTPLATAQAGGGRASADPALFVTLGFAFLGGLILNLMPCVFPILAIKVMNVARLSGHAHRTVVTHAASYTLGVLAAFAALAGVLMVLRAAGGLAGWGFQFQSPIFVTLIAWLLFAIGLNLSGVFKFAGGIAGTGDRLTRLDGHVGSFFTGLLAVVVATPCTVPFMGAAVAVAAAAAPIVALLIFLMMGLGLAAPYGVLAIVPGASRLLPRPGRWMVVLREALAFPMYGAAVWLVWVISREAGTNGVFVVLSGTVLMGFAIWLLRATRESGGRVFGRLGAAAALVSAFALLANLDAPSDSATAAAGDEARFSAARLATLRAEGRPVFVDMTAAWCVTCLVNERVALASEPVREAFIKRNIAYLKGDWTRADPEVTRFLREYHHDGVPLYVFYPPKGMPPVVLPQILTAATVLHEINRFGG